MIELSGLRAYGVGEPLSVSDVDVSRAAVKRTRLKRFLRNEIELLLRVGQAGADASLSSNGHQRISSRRLLRMLRISRLLLTTLASLPSDADRSALSRLAFHAKDLGSIDLGSTNQMGLTHCYS